MTILLLLELGTADRVAVDYAEFLTSEILVTDVTAYAPLLLPSLSPSLSALFSLLQSSNWTTLLRNCLNNILGRTFSKSPCKKKPINNPKSVLPKQKEAGLREISFSSKLHLQPFSLKFHSKLTTFDWPRGTMSHAEPCTMPRWHPARRSQAAPHLCTSCLPPHSHFSAPPSIAQRLCGQHTPVSPSVVWPAASFSTRAPANTDSGWGGAEGSLHHHQCVCVYVCAGGSSPPHKSPGGFVGAGSGRRC